MNELIARLTAGQRLDYPLFEPHDVMKKIHLVVISSDRGLCGGFNNAIFKKAIAFYKEQTEKGIAVQLSFFGKRGWEFFRKKDFVTKDYFEGVVNAPTFAHADRVGSQLVHEFLQENIDEVYLLFNRFKSAISQVPELKKILPLSAEAPEGEIKKKLFIIEPDPEEILNDLALRSVKFIVYRSLLMSATAEQAARMTAMDSATNNCDELIDKTTLKRNKARQAAITKELVEIVSGAESL
jgi:F-type H+-transporting ATPase subunit gamma